MRPPQLRVSLPRLITISAVASVLCVVLAMYLGFAARNNATDRAVNLLAAEAEAAARQIDGDMAQFDLLLRETARLSPPNDTAPGPVHTPLLGLPLTSRYVGFINVLNEVGDVVADPRSNVSRPVNFAGRDYFRDHQQSPADVVMVGRPFATAPTQHASIPLSRRIDGPDGKFAGVVVAGVRLAWLNDIIAHPSPAARATFTIRREDGLILTRSPFDPDVVGTAGAADPAWQNYLRTGLPEPTTDRGGIHLFRRLGAPPLVLELSFDPAQIANGEPFWPLWLALLVVAPALCILGFGLTSRRLSREARRIETDARTANDERMRLLANMSHELRTPLTGILGQAELLTQEGGLSVQQATRMARLTEAGALMRQIVDRVIDMTHPDDTFAQPILLPCDLESLARTCLGIVEGEARAKGVRLTSSFDPAAPRQAMLERDRVQQMVINLLMNAVKYTDSGSVSLRISGDASLLRFEVADTGPGIAPDKRWRLFRAYDRLGGTEPRAGSSGLGLSITQRFARRMGGQVGHNENPGGGSVFWIELPIADPAADPPAPCPLAPCPLAPCPLAPCPLATTTSAFPAEPAAEIRHLRLLLADDMDLTRSVTGDFLRSAGHLVTEVCDGESAVAKVRESDFDVVLTDMRMPIVDGLEVARRIRALPGHRGRTPVVLVTADLMALAAGASGQTGIDVCVRKPFTRAELLSAVMIAAGLAPVPEDNGSVFDPAILADLKSTVGDTVLAAHFDTAASRIDDLLTLLDEPDADQSRVTRDAVHDLIGVAGLLGLTALSVNLRWFDTAEHRGAPAVALRGAATTALLALRRARDPTAVDR